MKIAVDNSLAAYAKLHIRFLEAQTFNGFIFADQLIEIQLYGVEYLVVSDTADHNIIIGRVLVIAAAQNEVKPFI